MRMSFRPSRGRARAVEPPGDVLMPLVTLHAVADRGCELQGRAEAVLLACSLPGEPDSAIAREGGYVAGEYHRLYGWASDVQGAADGGSLQRRLAQLLMYHSQVVHLAVRLAFPKYRVPGAELRCRDVPALGDAGAGLLAVRDELATRIALLEND